MTEQQNLKGLTKDTYGTLPDGRAAYLYTLTSQNGVTAKITDFGGIITSLYTPDKNGKTADIVLGRDSLDSYISSGNPGYLGALIGRFANRIGDAGFTLRGQDYSLPVNNGPHSLHGGDEGFDKRLWNLETSTEDPPSITLSLQSPDGDQGYPGNLLVKVTYTLTDDDELVIEYSAKTDKTTVVNFTNHSYFNLAGHAAGSILDHEVYINAKSYTPVNDALIPTGRIDPVSGTPLDFTSVHTIGERIDDVSGAEPGGYDHNFVLDKTDRDELSLAARICHPGTARCVEVMTTEPGMQFYTGNFLDGTIKGKEGAVYKKLAGFCLETQHFPDSPNQPNFPDTTLEPGEEFKSKTVYRFFVKQ